MFRHRLAGLVEDIRRLHAALADRKGTLEAALKLPRSAADLRTGHHNRTA
ncbi:MAG: hypothetical protein MZW92_63615 [Comamonadaceae bacterium]|nr:hypothetical protein [Comamonadaceae bacterium]